MDGQGQTDGPTGTGTDRDEGQTDRGRLIDRQGLMNKDGWTGTDGWTDRPRDRQRYTHRQTAGLQQMQQ